VRIDAYSIVPHPYAQLRVPKGDFGFNVMRSRVLIGVAHGFAHDSINLITNARL
jgi:hypothetical protein